jgi:hypothetical protein
MRQVHGWGTGHVTGKEGGSRSVSQDRAKAAGHV